MWREKQKVKVAGNFLKHLKTLKRQFPSSFSQTHNIGNNANDGIRGFTTWKHKNPMTKCYPQWGFEHRPLNNLWFQVQHSPFWANWVFACKTETLGSLYSHALLILTKSFKSRNQVMHEHKFKDPVSSSCQISSEGECWTWNQRLITGPSSILIGNFVTGFFVFT